MRMSESELKSKYFSQWNDAHSNIQRVLYGYDPHMVWDAKECERYQKWVSDDSTRTTLGIVLRRLCSYAGISMQSIPKTILWKKLFQFSVDKHYIL